MASYYLVSRNSDLTEGKSCFVDIAPCRCLSTVKRLMETVTPIVYKNPEYIPIEKIPIQEPSEQDLQEEKRWEAIQRARMAGLSEEDIRSLMS